MTIAVTSTDDAGAQDGSIILYSWNALTTAVPDGSPIRAGKYADRYITAQGTWGGATLTIEGSNDGVNWFPLSNAAGGAALTFTANGGKSVIERPSYMRPNLTVVGTAASIVVVCNAAVNNPLRT